jgi:hypothetical protein
MDCAAALATIGASARALGNARDVEGELKVLDRLADALIGHRMFTALLYHADTRETERFYTNQVTRYPLRGRKPPRDDLWSNTVLERGEIFFVPDQAFLKSNFADADTLIDLGIGSGMCLPIRSGGRTLGTINVLNVPGAVAEAHLDLGPIIAALAVPAFQKRALA